MINKWLSVFVLLGLLASITACRTSNQHINTNKKTDLDTSNNYYVVAYVAGWSTIGVSTLNAAKLTHINYAFANLDETGRVYFENQVDPLKIDTLNQLKRFNPKLKIIVSIGGWSWSKHFSTIAASPTLRKQFANNIISFIKKYKLDGIDLDWEYPCMKGNGNKFSAHDKENFTLMLSDIRKALSDLKNNEKQKNSYILTIAAGTSRNYIQSIEPTKILNYVDFIHLMTYDYRSGDSKETGHHSNLWPSISSWNNGDCIDQTIKRYTKAGVPVEKLVLGVPFYGRKWEGVTTQNNGLYQDATTTGQSIQYRFIRTHRTSENGYRSYWDDSAQVPYLWNQKERIFISYENPLSIRYKVEYMKRLGLRGIMFWEHTGDYNNELFKAVTQHLENDNYESISNYKAKITLPIIGIHPILVDSFYSSQNQNNDNLILPNSLVGFAALPNLLFSPSINALWLSQLFI